MSYSARHAASKPVRRPKPGRAATVAALAGLAVATTVVAEPTSAQASTYSAGARGLSWAEAHATGHPYVWGGTGPYGYDCSGLVVESIGRATGIWLPRTTYAMLRSRHLHWIPLSQARRGDLLFFGTGHVEFNTVWYHQSYGAHHSGTTVGWSHYDPAYWGPTAAYRVY